MRAYRSVWSEPITFASDIASAKTANARRLPDAKCEHEPLGRGTAFVGLGEQRLHSSTAKWATASSAASRTSEGDSGDCKSQLGKVPELLRGYKRGTSNLTTRRGASSSSSLRRKTTVKTGTVKTTKALTEKRQAHDWHLRAPEIAVPLSHVQKHIASPAWAVISKKTPALSAKGFTTLNTTDERTGPAC